MKPALNPLAGLAVAIGIAVLALGVGLALSMQGGEEAPATQSDEDPPADRTYTLQAGDTLGGLAAQFGVPADEQAAWIDELLRVNAIDDPTALTVGLELTLPSSSPPGQSVVASPTAEPTGPAPSPAASGADGSPFFGPIDDGFERRDLAPGEVPAEEHGVAFADPATGEGEVWTLPLVGDPILYSVDPSHRWLQVRRVTTWPHADVVIADRQGGESYRLNGEQWALVAGPVGEGLLVVQSRHSPDAFGIVDLDADPTAIATRFSIPFDRIVIDYGPEIPSSHAVWLGDDQTLLLSLSESGELEPGKDTGPPRLFKLDSAGRVEEYEGLGGELHGTDDGGALVLALGNDGIVGYRFDETGKLIGEHALEGDGLPVSPFNPALVSPDGRRLAWGGALPLHGEGRGEIGYAAPFPTTMVAELDAGALPFRVLRAIPVRWLENGAGVLTRGAFDGVGAAWLQALGSGEGLLVSLPVERTPDAAVEGFGVLRLDGSLEELAPEPDGLELLEWVDGYVGLDAAGTEVRVERSRFPGGDSGRARVPPAGLPPVVQQPPFPGAVQLRVESGGDGLNVRRLPGVDEDVLGTLPDGALVTVTNSEDPGPCGARVSEGCSAAYGEPSPWLHVRADDGLEGWASAEYLAWPR